METLLDFPVAFFWSHLSGPFMLIVDESYFNDAAAILTNQGEDVRKFDLQFSPAPATCAATEFRWGLTLFS